MDVITSTICWTLMVVLLITSPMNGLALAAKILFGPLCCFVIRLGHFFNTILTHPRYRGNDYFSQRCPLWLIDHDYG